MENIQNQVEDREQDLFDDLMNAVFDLADELMEKDDDDLTEAEDNFLYTLSEWCSEIDKEEEE